MQEFRVEPESYAMKANGTSFGLQECTSAGAAIDLHIHSAIELLYFLRGEFEVLLNNESHKLCPGALILFHKNTAHAVNALSPDGGVYYVFKIHPSIFKDVVAEENSSVFQMFFSLDAREPRCIWREEELRNSRILQAIRQIIEDYDREDIFCLTALKLNMGRFLLAIMQDSYSKNPEHFRLLKRNTNMTATIQKAVEHIHTHYAENLTTRKTAELLNLSYSYFSNCFSQVTGRSFKQYLNQTRVNHAKRALLNTSGSISQIGTMVGYNSTSYFILEFKRQTGMTPLEFLKRFRN